jgi:hypothetical protein
MNGTSDSLYRNRIFVSLILSSAGFVDLIYWALTEQRVGGFIVNYFVLGTLFALQHAFKAVQLLFIGLLSLWVLYWLMIHFKSSEIYVLIRFLSSWFNNQSVQPLTLALGIITFLGWRFSRNYDFTNG